jgi:sugar phosphate isomerase/epimerase
MGGRLLPGEGELPLVPMLRGLLRRDPGLTVGVEVFSDELRALSPPQIAARVAASTRGVLRQALGK